MSTSPDIKEFVCTNFSGGLNTLFDERSIAPYTQEDAAESPEMENVDITARGRIVTSQGYELVSFTTGTGGCKDLLTYDKNVTEKYLIAAYNDHLWSLTAAATTWVDLGAYGTSTTTTGGTVYKGKTGIRWAVIGTNSPSAYVPAYLTGNTSAESNFATWAAVTDGSFSITIDGIYYNIDGIDFTGDANMANVASTIQAAIRAATGGSETVAWVTDHFVIHSANTTFESTITVVGTSTGTVGTDISGVTGTWLDANTGRGTVTSATGIIKKWNGVTLSNIGANQSGWIMEEFMGRLFVASGRTLYYSEIEDETDFGSNIIGFNDIITGLRAQGDYLLVFTRGGVEAVQFYYNDSFSLSVPLKKPYKQASGTRAFKTVQPVYNDTYYFSTTDGFQKFGADAQFIAQSLRVNSLSWKIDPSLTDDKYNANYIDQACAVYFRKKYYGAIPYGSDSFNSRIYVYNWDYDAWTLRTGFYPANFAVLPDANLKDELYFASQLSPEIYKFNNEYTYAGAGYLRKWKSKKFTFGSAMRSKFYYYLDLKGAIFTNTTFYVTINVDGQEHTYSVDSSNLETSSVGGYYGDDYLGDLLYGGESENPFKRYGIRIPIPQDLKSGREFQVTIYNQAAGQPWSVDYMAIAYSYDQAVKIPTTFQNVTQA